MELKPVLFAAFLELVEEIELTVEVEVEREVVVEFELVFVVVTLLSFLVAVAEEDVVELKL